ncbi:LG3BP-like protein [Mya arenaria]|uniref:LG3BP-like protein n=1 Tax=Mya arenaria TaxID=6604 RepID=A0ABY7DF46_MYAAR|nr:LG3BP-like protein [Mya arenaria]
MGLLTSVIGVAFWLTVIKGGRNTMYRLADGNSIKSGRVEALYNGTWLGICMNNYFATYEATMICNKIGFTQNGYVLSPSYTMKSPSINGLICDGNETDLSDCNSNTWGQEMSCENVQITCSNKVSVPLFFTFSTEFYFLKTNMCFKTCVLYTFKDCKHREPKVMQVMCNGFHQTVLFVW